MRLLWLGTSDDINPAIPPGERAHAVAAAMLEDASGERVEVEVRRVWPVEGLPAVVERWLDRSRADVVFLTVVGYWFTYESVPENLRHRLPVIGERLAGAALRASTVPRLSESAAFHATRRLALRALGGRTYFTPDQVTERVGAVIRAVVAREGTVLVVRGPTYPDDYSGRAARIARLEADRLRVHRALRRLTTQLHVPYLGFDVPLYPADARIARTLGDRVHMTSATHAEHGRMYGTALVEAWRAAHSAAGPAV